MHILECIAIKENTPSIYTSFQQVQTNINTIQNPSKIPTSLNLLKMYLLIYSLMNPVCYCASLPTKPEYLFVEIVIFPFLSVIY